MVVSGQGRLEGWLTALLALWSLTLSGCQLLPREPLPEPGVAGDAGRDQPGTLHFQISPGHTGSYYGWQVEVAAAEHNKGFISFTSRPMEAGERLDAQLWADRYQVRVLHLGRVRFQEWVPVSAGGDTLISVKLSFLRSTVTPLVGAEARGRLYGKPSRIRDLSSNYQPFTVHAGDGLRVIFDGPQYRGELAGPGRLEFIQNGATLATMEQARIAANEIIGELRFKDERKVDQALNGAFSFPDGTVSEWSDGRRFEGAYRGLQPDQGKLQLPDGDLWYGSVELLMPRGPGVLKRRDGSWLELPAGSDLLTLTGTVPCGRSSGGSRQCHYLDGQRLSSEADLKRRLASRQTSSSGPAAGCQLAQGHFSRGLGRSRLLLGPGGEGEFEQYSGSRRFRFYSAFEYQAQPERLDVKYGEGSYIHVESGQVLHRTGISEVALPCRFDGHTLWLEGKPYQRD